MLQDRTLEAMSFIRSFTDQTTLIFFLIEGTFALFIEKNLMIIVESLTVHVEYVVNVGIVQV